MNINGYFHKAPDKLTGNAMIISDTIGSRNKFMSDVMYRLYKKQIHENIKPHGKAAFLYIGGAQEHHSHARIYIEDRPKHSMPIFSQMGYMVSKLAARFENIEYLSINANTCASSMYALYEAEQLLNNGFDSVVIYGEEWVEDVELLLFKSLGIDVVCGDGLFVLCLDNGEGSIGSIFNVNWAWNNDKSPFGVSKDGYMKVLQPLAQYAPDIMKTHGTRTERNNLAEEPAIEEVFGDIERLYYKDQIGHTQGCSTGVELCMMLDEYKSKSSVLLASGLGGFYGSCYLEIH